VGGNTLVGFSPVIIEKGVDTMLKKKIQWKNPFGNGTTAKQLINILIKHL